MLAAIEGRAMALKKVGFLTQVDRVRAGFRFEFRRFVGVNLRDPTMSLQGFLPRRGFPFSRLRRECLHFVSRFVRREQE